MKLLPIVLTLVAIFLTCCVDEKGIEGKTYWHSENGRPTQIDPLQSSDFYQNMVVTNVYDTLFSYKYLKRAPYELKPNLAASMPSISDDGLTYTIKIKEGVVFINDACFQSDTNKEGKGREVVADDFIYSIKRHFDPKNSSRGDWLWKNRIVGLDAWKEEMKKALDEKKIEKTDYAKEIEGLKALDKYTIQIKLTKPFPQILYTFAMGFSAIIPREAVEFHKNKFAVHAVGSGPFKVKSFSESRVVLQKNSTYRKEIFDIYAEGYDEAKHGFTGIKKLHQKTLPIVDGVTISFMQQEVARWNSFTKGNEIQYATVPVDMIDSILETKKPPKLKKDLDEKYFLEAERELGVVFLFFNMEDPNIGYNDDPKRDAMNKALRKAIRKGFNWPQRIERFYYDLGEPFVGMIPPSVAGYTEFPKDSITHDVEGAKKLLADAGWTPETLPVLEYPNTASTKLTQFYEQFRDFMLKIGYPREKVKQRIFPTFGDYSKAMKDKKNMMNGYAWSLDYPDAENTMQLFYGPYASPGSNSCNFNHPEYNKLYDESKVLPHSEERTKIYKRMTEILLEECVGIFGFSRTNLKVWHKDAIVYPTREIISNYFKYVDVKEEEKPKANK